MKNIILVIIICSILSIIGCKPNDCTNVITYNSIDSRMTGYIFKQGTYWIYSDTVDGIIDSQYVCSFSHKVHYRSPADTPNHLYTVISPGGAVSSTYCGPYYLDSLSMSYISYQNGIYKDTLAMQVRGGIELYQVEHYNQPNKIGIVCFQLDFTEIGALGYKGIKDSISAAGQLFNNVSIFTIQMDSTKSTRFKYPTDLYFESGYGIIKIIEHKPNVNVPWVLTKCHIAS